MKLFAFTLDLEPDHGGRIAGQYVTIRDTKKVEEFLSVLQALDVRVTVFTVGEMFELFPQVIKIFEKYNCEFETHSYSHHVYKNPDSEDEIVKAKAAYYNYFGKNPKGYRAPHGRISDSGIKSLEKHEFLYDSSIFPSYFPNPMKYLFCDKQPHYYGNSGILEVPLTSITPFRLTLSISYIKLLGINFMINLCKLFGTPDTICFGTHMHDFIIVDSSYDMLSPFWKLIFGRNKYKGTEYCVKFLEYMKKEGYRFCYMSEIYDLHKKDL